MAYPDDFIPEIWSELLVRNLDKQAVLRNLVNRDYEGEIRRLGDTVHIQTLGSISLAAYTGSGLTYGNPTSSTQTLSINQDYEYSFGVDDLDAIQANIDLINRYTARAAQGITDTVEADIAAEWANAGLSSTAWDVGTTDAWTVVTTCGQKLDEANVPRGGRWMVVTPKGYANLLRNSNFIHATTDGDRVLRTGEVGTIGGFTVYMSNHLVNNTASTYQYIYGTNEAITLAMQMMGDPEAIRLEDSFKTGIRGRLVWGIKVVQANALGAIAADET